jgi:hypothetical protein
MNIKPMLVRLQSAMGRNDLLQQMVLLPEPAICSVDAAKSTQSVNLVVGYNRTPSSQTSLDIALWIAHQTRLATQKQVTVHIVYVVNDNQSKQSLHIFGLRDEKEISLSRLTNPSYWQSPEVSHLSDSTGGILTQSVSEVLVTSPEAEWVNFSNLNPIASHAHQVEQADRILWHARCLANEWGGSLTAHLRYGCVTTELRHVIESEGADVLFLGCNSVEHPLIQQLGFTLPCAVLGIPTILNSHEKYSYLNR